MAKGFGVGARRHAISYMALAVALAATPAWAQGARPASEVEEVVVTAQFREQNLQDTPIAITAVTAEMLEARSQTNITEVAAQAPNVVLKPQGAAFGPGMGASIRGIGQFDFNPALEPAVGIYIDDVYFPTITGSIFDLLDLERVEILRGPQGTLAGKNSIGGAIKLYSKKPTGEGGASLMATYGARNRLDFRASGDIKLTDTLFVRLAGVSKQQDGYIKRLDYGCVVSSSGVPANRPVGSDCVMADESNVNYSAVRASARWLASDNLEINVSADYTREDRNVAGQVLTFVTPYTGVVDINPYNVPLNFDARFLPPPGSYHNFATFFHANEAGFDERRQDGKVHFKGWGVSGQVEWGISDRLNLTSITAHRGYDTQFSNDNDLSPLAINLGLNDLEFTSTSQELRLNGAFGAGDAVEYTLGGFWMEIETIFGGLQDLRTSRLVFAQRDVVSGETRAAFAHVNWNLTEQLSLTGGVRYTDETKTYKFNRMTPAGAVHPTQGVLSLAPGNYAGDKVDYRASVQYRFTDDVMAYAQVSTGIKGGGISPRPFIPAQARPFEPETVTSYEAGVKADLFERRLRVNAAVFLGKFKEIQFGIGSCPEFGAAPACGVTGNAGDADVSGFEVEVSARPIEGLVIDAALSQLDFQYTRINPNAGGPARPTGVQLFHKRAYAPEWKWSLGVQYSIDLGDHGSLTPRIDAAYQDDMFTSGTNTAPSRIAAYTLANARLTWRNAANDLEVSAEVTNLTDEYYFLTLFDESAFGRVNAQPGRPREWALTVKKTF